MLLILNLLNAFSTAMLTLMALSGSLSDAFQVLTLFLIPIGGGIPAGVLLAKTRGLAWPLTTIVYFISDCILACAFEPLIYLFIKSAKTSPLLSRMVESYKKTLKKTGFTHGLSPTPFSLIILSFGVDPMTGRSAAKAVGHGFFAGWAIAITGDMFYFALIMASTLFLNDILGDGTWATILVMIAMIGVPALIRRIRKTSATP